MSIINRNLPKWLFTLWLMSGLNVANADTEREARPYAGGGVIALNLYDRTCDQPIRNGGSHSFTIIYRCGQDREISYTAFVGYPLFNRHWSAELGFLQASGFDYSGDGPYQTSADHPVGVGEGDLSLRGGHIEMSALYLAVIGRYPINDALALTGRLGAHRWDYESCGTITHTASTGTAPDAGFSCKMASGSDPLFGIGADWDLNENLRSQITLTRYRLSSTDIEVIGVNLVYLFQSQ